MAASGSFKYENTQNTYAAISSLAKYRQIEVCEKKQMTKEEEKAIFDTATEKLDLYMQSFLKYKYVDDVREFLQPGGPYVRFALRGFMKELLDEMIKPVGE